MSKPSKGESRYGRIDSLRTLDVELADLNFLHELCTS